jgi:hypothetical protein
MSIDVKEIIKLIRAAKGMLEKLPKEEQYIHAADLIATLQPLVDNAITKEKKDDTDTTPEYKEWGC